MRQVNYLNFEKHFINKFVYCYMTLDRFFMLFEKRQNVLSHPRNWSDPFENFILNAKIKNPDGTLSDFGFRDRVYGQCWTVERRSDALWQVFCPMKHKRAQGIRIRTTSGKLGATFSRSLWQPGSARNQGAMTDVDCFRSPPSAADGCGRPACAIKANSASLKVLRL